MWFLSLRCSRRDITERVVPPQGVSLQASPTFGVPEHEEERRYEERGRVLRRIPQSLHPFPAAVTHHRYRPWVSQCAKDAVAINSCFYFSLNPIYFSVYFSQGLHREENRHVAIKLLLSE